jgi:hypothetical protein
MPYSLPYVKVSQEYSASLFRTEDWGLVYIYSGTQNYVPKFRHVNIHSREISLSNELLDTTLAGINELLVTKFRVFSCVAALSASSSNYRYLRFLAWDCSVVSCGLVGAPRPKRWVAQFICVLFSRVWVRWVNSDLIYSLCCWDYSLLQCVTVICVIIVSVTRWIRGFQILTRAKCDQKHRCL